MFRLVLAVSQQQGCCRLQIRLQSKEGVSMAGDSEKKVFTHLYIKNLEAKDKQYYIRERDGFGIRVLPSGRKIWVFIYTFDGRRREMNLGSYPKVGLAKAKEKFKAASEVFNDGKDPQDLKREEKRKRLRTPTVESFVSEYIEKHAIPKLKSWKEVQRALREVVRRIGDLKITDVRRSDLKEVLDSIIDRGSGVMANRVQAYTSSAFTYAVEQEYIEINPFLGMRKRFSEQARERALSPEEIKRFWHNLPQAVSAETTRRALMLILITAQRPGEVVGIHRREIEERWWTIPSTRTKNGLPHRVYLTDTALGLIGSKDGYIFESPARPGNPLQGQVLSRSINHNSAKEKTGDAELPEVGESTIVNLLDVDPFTPHDLRRTAITGMAALGIPDDDLDRVMNHIYGAKNKKKMLAVYNRYRYDKEKQAAWEAWDARLIEIIGLTADSNVSESVIKTKTGAKVISIDRARR